MDIVTLKDLTFHYGNQIVLKKLNLTIQQGTFLTVLGPSGSGKTTLLQLLLGMQKAQEGQILIENDLLDIQHMKEIRSMMGFVCDLSSHYFTANTVASELAFVLENLCYPKQEMKERINEVAALFGIDDLLEASPQALNCSEKQIVAFASALVHHPKILLLDEAFYGMNSYDIEKVFRILKKLNREEDLTIICATSNVEYSLYGKEILVLKNGKVFLYGKKQDVLQEEKKLKQAFLELPFMADLSHKLSYYGLVDKPIYNMSRMVKHLWK